MAQIKQYALICQYDGTSYQGFQSQKNQNTIQDKIEFSLNKIINKKIHIEYAGRTDSGVHATHQVITFKTAWSHSNVELQNAINAHLPDDIYVKDINVVPDTFHPRKSAISRTYEYKVLNTYHNNIFTRTYNYHYPNKLNTNKIKEGLKILEGKHDYSNFCKKESLPENSIRYIYSSTLTISGEMLLFKFNGSSFLRHQIRFMVGYLIEIGRDKYTLNDLKSLLDTKNRAKSVIKHNVSPRGLCLTLVEYDGFSFKKNVIV